jgi:hypothetical protein
LTSAFQADITTAIHRARNPSWGPLRSNGMVKEDYDVLTLVRRALDEFEDVPLGASARRALRIALLRGEGVDGWLIQNDLKPMGGSHALRDRELAGFFPDVPGDGLRHNRTVLTEEWMKERMPSRVDPLLEPLLKDDGSGTMMAGSIEEIERRVQLMGAERDAETDVKGRYLLDCSIAMDIEILGRIRHRVFAYLCRCEALLAFESVNSAIFDRHRAVVDAHLRQLAPDVFTMMTAAYRRVRDQDGESLSQALVSCRRVLKAVADIVYPASDKPVVDSNGKSHDLGSENYKNRLFQFLADSSPHRNVGRLCHASLEEIDGRVGRLNDLASKGVHDEISAQEVDLCIIQTYLLAGEVLTIFDTRAATKQAVTEPPLS